MNREEGKAFTYAFWRILHLLILIPRFPARKGKEKSYVKSELDERQNACMGLAGMFRRLYPFLSCGFFLFLRVFVLFCFPAMVFRELAGAFVAMVGVFCSDMIIWLAW